VFDGILRSFAVCHPAWSTNDGGFARHVHGRLGRRQAPCGFAIVGAPVGAMIFPRTHGFFVAGVFFLMRFLEKRVYKPKFHARKALCVRIMG